ncbi:hypothetical protein ES703_55314 [subsurface metagenome]
MKNSKKYLRGAFSITFLVILISLFNFGSAVLDPGGGGDSTPPAAPTLYQPISPDYDHSIALSWSNPYNAISYEVYRSPSEYGRYVYVATTTYQTSYTDVRDMGTWWYKVRAHNAYGWSGCSNPVCVMVPNQFDQIYYENGYYYSPTKTFLYTDDDAVITFNVRQDTDAQGIVDNNHPWFKPSLIISLNPDSDPNPPALYTTENYYIHSVKLKWKLLNPNGQYLQYHDIDNIQNNYFSLEGTSTYPELTRLWDLAFALYDLIPYSLAGVLKELMTPNYITSTFTSFHDTNYDYGVKWTEGYWDIPGDNYIGWYPNNMIEEASMLVDFITWIPDFQGVSVLEFYWEIVVHHFVDSWSPFSGTHLVSHEYAFTLSGDYFLEFNYNG